MPSRLAFLVLVATLLCQACETTPDQVATAAEPTTEAAAESEGATVVLLPGEDQYHLVRLDVGALAISLDTIAAEGGGAVVRLQIGNTMAAGLEDLSATLQWGPLASDGTPETSPERTREVPLAPNVAGGSWTQASFTLADVPPSELRFIRLSHIEFTRLILK